MEKKTTYKKCHSRVWQNRNYTFVMYPLDIFDLHQMKIVLIFIILCEVLQSISQY